MNKSNKSITRDDRGCYADGAFGHDHVRSVLAGLLYETYADEQHEVPERIQNLIDLLQKPTSDPSILEDDPFNDAEDEAIDLLNDVTEEGVYWMFRDGDLVLTEEEEEIKVRNRSILDCTHIEEEE